jgi:hypothetical protein
MIPIETITPPMCAYEQQCRAQAEAIVAGHPELMAALNTRCATLRKPGVKEWQIRDCQRAMGFIDAVLPVEK